MTSSPTFVHLFQVVTMNMEIEKEQGLTLGCGGSLRFFSWTLDRLQLGIIILIRKISSNVQMMIFTFLFLSKKMVMMLSNDVINTSTLNI